MPSTSHGTLSSSAHGSPRRKSYIIHIVCDLPMVTESTSGLSAGLYNPVLIATLNQGLKEKPCGHGGADACSQLSHRAREGFVTDTAIAQQCL